jgi:hypothetical protein
MDKLLEAFLQAFGAGIVMLIGHAAHAKQEDD